MIHGVGIYAIQYATYRKKSVPCWARPVSDLFRDELSLPDRPVQPNHVLINWTILQQV
jgi:hypothetical protein